MLEFRIMLEGTNDCGHILGVLKEHEEALHLSFCSYSFNAFDKSAYSPLIGCFTLIYSPIFTHISPASFLWDIDKQCRTRSDAANLI